MLTLVVVIIIFVAVYFFLKSQKRETSKEQFKKNFSSEVNQDDWNEINEDIDLDIFNTKYRPKKGIKTNPFFLDMQFHTDYRDTLTAFNDIAPAQQLIFNKANLPTTFSTPPYKEVDAIVKEFIKEVNKTVMFSVTNYRQSNTGWDETIPDKTMESGWDKQQQSLGLPSSLYADPAKRAPIVLIKIDNVEKYVTEFQTQYVIILIVQKKNVEDQMIVKISFIKENIDINLERKLFDDINADYNKESDFDNSNIVEKPTYNTDMVIEEIFVVGFLSKEGLGGDKPFETNLDLYNFKGLETNDLIDQRMVMKELINKKRQINKEMNNFTAILDPNDQQFHKDIPKLEEYKAYKCTRTIFDDLSGKPVDYD